MYFSKCKLILWGLTGTSSALECSGNMVVRFQRLLNAFTWDYL